MGNKQIMPIGNCSTGRFKLEDYEPLRPIREGKSLMINRHSKKLAIVIERTFPTQQQLTEYMKRNKSNLSLAHQFYLSAFDHQIIAQSTICSKQYRLLEFYQNQSHTVADEIENRIHSNKQFSNKQIMSILCSCVLAMSHFCKNQILHYTLNPTDIVIDEDGLCKILSSSLSDNLFDYNQKRDFYYAPETLKMFKNQSISNGLTNKSAVFTLGMTILHMTSLQQMTHIYNFNSYIINNDILQQQLSRVNDSNLQLILSKMLKIHSYQRITFTELEEMIFQIIAQSENQPKSKLTEQISKIKSNDQSRSSDVTNNTHKSDRILTTRLLDKDEEDQAQKQKDHILYSFEDAIVLDEFEQPINMDFIDHNNYMTQQNSQIKFTCGIASRNQDRSPLSTVTYHNNSSTFKQDQFYKHSESNIKFIQKQNQNVGQLPTRRNKQCSQPNQDVIYPEYVSEQLKQGRYEGYKLGNYRHGFGSFHYNEGGRYCGQWMQNRMQGKGVLYYPSGKIAYEGQWKEDRLDGYGVLYNESITILNNQYDYQHLEQLNNQWIKYEGYFKNDVKEGQGTIFLSNGQTYRGNFESDQPHGKGQYRNVRGETIRGYWLMGALNTLT